MAKKNKIKYTDNLSFEKRLLLLCFVTYSVRDHFVYLFFLSFSLPLFLAKSLHINYLQMRRHRRKQINDIEKTERAGWLA